MTLQFLPLPTNDVRALQAGRADANGQSPETLISDGAGIPCRHCLQEVPAGKPYLILAYRPFPKAQPYAEVGPIFLCADTCAPHADGAALPEILGTSPDYLLKGYGADDRIVYGTGQVTPREALRDTAEAILARPDVEYVHVRSARNNCYQCRIDRA
ncbi:MAG: DUF1203 domain-containing protein [Pseudomonadota bacterium]